MFRGICHSLILGFIGLVLYFVYLDGEWGIVEEPEPPQQTWQR